MGSKPLPAGDELDVAQAGNGRSAYLVRGKRVGRGAIGAVAAVDVGQQQAKTPVCAGPVAQAHGGVAVDGAALDLLVAAGVVDRGHLRGRNAARARAQLALVDVVVLQAQAPAGGGRIAHGCVGGQGTTAGGAGQGGR